MRLRYQLAVVACCALALGAGERHARAVSFEDGQQPADRVWVQRFPQTSPPARVQHSMVYDSDRGVVIMFGGRSFQTGTLFSDTWEWNGTDWRQVAAGAGEPVPAGRFAQSMVYDRFRHRVVMFGGWTGGSEFLNDTWEFDGARWSRSETAIAPHPRFGGAIAYDPIRRKTVLFGGFSYGSSYSADTWEWDGTTWTHVPAAGPSPRTHGSLFFDATRQRVLLYGGVDYSNVFNEMWQYEPDQVPAAWVQLPIAASDMPPANLEYAFVTSAPSKGVAILFGGVVRGSATALADTWEWSGEKSRWAAVSTSVAPSGRMDGANYGMAYDERRGEVVLFGGEVPGVLDNAETWTLGLRVGYHIAVLYDQDKAHTSGSTIPVAIGLRDAAGTDVSSAQVSVTAFAISRVSDAATFPVDDAGTANPGRDFRFVGDSYLFNLKTTGLTTGTYLLHFTVGADPAEYSVRFQIK